jgi:hypothetical protein
VASQVQKKNDQEPKKKKGTMISSKKKWTVMNPMSCGMKKRSPSSGQNSQLVHWRLLTLAQFNETLGV